ncbi:DNA topoisomerase IB [Sphingomonas sp. M1-B02]|uniref:DNA topoisomerase IB n=1 Tax=Sphingomonas sp. M1-B02 TaxID=3114300 RepID=UPI0022406BA9|nr:DNA topoisomerase IB [Sphingomonas sp. S6-11]UZK66095.1 DNA topoisomerase IB [Sphingomonas sp. S6-11]
MTAADIVYVDDHEPGITRRKMRHGWGYFDPQGTRITDRDAIDRLNAVGLPPAYRDAWYCPDPNGHIQATAKDDKGRKQYRYHVGFREAQEAAKYDRCAGFGEALPLLRSKVEHDLKLRGLCKSKAVAAVVRLLDLGTIRVGNESYAQANKSFGATTLRKRHVQVKGNSLRLQFRAKSGKMRLMTITDGSLSRFVKRCQDLPGQHLFRWIDDAGEAHPVTSTDVNCYIREAMKQDFTAKHFRTWGASVLAFEALAGADSYMGIKSMLEPVTEALGNTPSIARKSYVHPRLIDLAKDREAQAAFRAGLRLPRSTRYLTRFERGLIAFLEEAADAPQAKAA